MYVKQYDQGVPLGERSTYEADADAWLLDGLELDTKAKARMRIAISWPTLRYKKTVDVSQNGGRYNEAVAGYGRCEIISSGVAQKGE